MPKDANKGFVASLADEPAFVVVDAVSGAVKKLRASVLAAAFAPASHVDAGGGVPSSIANEAGTTSFATEDKANAAQIKAGGALLANLEVDHVDLSTQTDTGSNRNALVSMDAGPLYEPKILITARESSTNLSVIEMTRDSAQMRAFGMAGGDVGGSLVRVRTGVSGSVEFQRLSTSGNPTGTAIKVWDPANLTLPVGATSILGAISALKTGLDELAAKALAPWTPSFVAGANASAVTLLHATQRSEGDYVTLRGALSITAVAAGPATVSAPLPVNEDGTDTVGIASGVAGSAALAYCVAATTDLEVVVDAPAAGDCVVAFDVQYKKAP